MTNRKAIRKKNAASNLNKQFMMGAVKVIAKKIVDEKVKNNGRAPWGFASKLLEEGRKTFPSMSRRTLNNYIKRLEKEIKIGRTIITDGSSNNMSSITDRNSYGDNEASNNASANGPSIQPNESTGAKKSDTSNTDSNIDLDDADDTSDTDSNSDLDDADDVTTEEASGITGIGTGNDNHPKLGGRPKGSTIASGIDLINRISAAMKDATVELEKMQAAAKVTRERLKKGALTEVISDCKARHGLPDNISINEGSIRQRLKRGSKSTIRGTKSPMADIEPYIVLAIIQLANMRVPITTAQGLQLCNSIIQGTKFKKNLSLFQSKNLRSTTTVLGPGYWRGFLRRNKHLITSKKAVKFDTKRAEWCTYQNLEEMYNEVYSHLVASGLAVKHEKDLYRDENGNVVASEEEAMGLKSPFELIHPEMLVFVDEVGSNTSQAKDGAIGGQTYLCSKDGRPQQHAATKDAHFTVLGFTAANGVPLMCAIIFAAKTMRSEWALGFDPFADWIGSEENVRENIGEGKAMPQGPHCTFNDKHIPCFCACTENGSITGELLRKMLETIDEIGVFDREGTGLNPFLLLDGHGSRFELDFLDYINTAETKWECCIGLPYGTSYWQVGDSSEQNGCFKMALTRAKQELVTKKNDAGLPFAIDKTDVVGLVRAAWNRSFARVRTNIKAVTSRGWGPKALNYNCLLHPEIQATKHGTTGKPHTLALKTTAAPEDLNLSDGLSATLIDKIVLYKNREANRNGTNADEQRRKRKETAEERLRSHDKRISAGLLASAGHFHLGSDVRDHIQQRVDAAIEKERSMQLRKKDEYDALLAKVQAIKNLNLPYDKWNATQLKTMVKWYKRDGDEKLPGKKQELIARYLATCERQDLPPPPLPIGFAPLPLLPMPEDGAIEAPEPPNGTNVPHSDEINENDTSAELNHDDYEEDEREVAEFLLAAPFANSNNLTAIAVGVTPV